MGFKFKGMQILPTRNIKGSLQIAFREGKAIKHCLSGPLKDHQTLSSHSFCQEGEAAIKCSI